MHVHRFMGQGVKDLFLPGDRPSYALEYAGFFGVVIARLGCSILADAQTDVYIRGLADYTVMGISGVEMCLTPAVRLLLPAVLATPALSTMWVRGEYCTGYARKALVAALLTSGFAVAGSYLSPSVAVNKLLNYGAFTGALALADSANRMAGRTVLALGSRAMAGVAVVATSILAVQTVGGGDIDSIVAALGLSSILLLRGLARKDKRALELEEAQINLTKAHDWLQFRAQELPKMIQKLQQEAAGFKIVHLMVGRAIDDWVENCELSEEEEAKRTIEAMKGFINKIVFLWGTHCQWLRKQAVDSPDANAILQQFQEKFPEEPYRTTGMRLAMQLATKA